MGIPSYIQKIFTFRIFPKPHSVFGFVHINRFSWNTNNRLGMLTDVINSLHFNKVCGISFKRNCRHRTDNDFVTAEIICLQNGFPLPI